MINKSFIPFDVVQISESEFAGGSEMLIHLDEKLLYPDGHSMESVQSQGFIKTTSINDFPIRGKRVRLLIRRRKWVDKITGRSISRPLRKPEAPRDELLNGARPFF